jgi:putative CocE/NonD family hydrolase
MSAHESIKIEHNVPAKMRDGTNLYADIWRPDTKDRYPVIITRLPYNKNVLFPIAAGYLNPQRYARAGYVVVLQDVRGTGASDGEPHFWWQEVDDGYDTVEWTAEQSWCDGNVGMFGYSYFGYTQWAAAVSRPPHLKAICPGFTEHIPRSFPFTNRWDAFKLGIHLRWALMISYLALLRGKLPPEELKLIG